MTRRVGIEAWQGPLLDGREATVTAARRALAMVRHMRTVRPYGWRPIAAQYLTEARLLRTHVATGDVGAVFLARLTAQDAPHVSAWTPDTLS